MPRTRADAPPDLLPARFRQWFAARGWEPRAHQLELIGKARAGRSALLVAPTGAGKTLAGFLPTLIDLADRRPSPEGALHTLYISPLKALAVDVLRNLERPIEEMGLTIRAETRTGDTPPAKRRRQKERPPDILLTTPEQLALLIADRSAAELFGSLRRVVLDELHATVTAKRGDLLALGLARLRKLAPGLAAVGLSATVREPAELCRYLVAQTPATPETALADLVQVSGGAAPDLSILTVRDHIPWAGHTALHALPQVYEEIRRHHLSLVFVNTRSQAEMLFQALWRINDDGLPIALHHGSLDVAQRRRVEEAMAEGRLKAVVCTSTLDLGIDWGDVDLVLNIGAPKGASRLLQRIGRANHRLDEPSKAILVPSNRFEVLECEAALEAAKAGEQDTPPPRKGALDVLAQHVLGMAVADPFDADALYAEVTSAAPYAALPRKDFDDTVAFVATGGYALKSYERFAKIRQGKDGLWRIVHPAVAQQYRLNVGTIVEEAMLKVRLVGSRRTASGRPLGRGGRVLGEIEEYFIEGLVPGDSFVFGGEVVAYEALGESEVLVSRSAAREPKVPAYAGGKFPLSTYLAARVRRMLSDPLSWEALPGPVAAWLTLQQGRSELPGTADLLVETFPRGGRFYMTCYPFEGRLAHQTLGMLLTRRLERARQQPMGFVATDYALTVWGLADLGASIRAGRLSLDALFDQDMLGDDLEAWLDESAMMKRTFRTCAVIAGMIERRFPGEQKTGRQVTMSSDLIYDVLRRHESDHLLIRAARADAATGLLDIARLGEMLKRVAGRIRHKDLERISPLAVPVMLEIGREPVYGEASEALLAAAAEDLIREAMGDA